MALSLSQVQIKWSTANSLSVTAGTGSNSDTATVSGAATARQITVKADNSGTPAAADTVDFYLLRTSGDPDADADVADEFDSDNHGMFLGRLNTNSEDPALATFDLPRSFDTMKLRAYNNAASNAITVSAQVEEQVSS